MNTGNSRFLPFPLNSRASDRPFATARCIKEDVQTLRFQSGASYERSPASNLTSPAGQGRLKKLAQRRRGAEEQNVDGGSSGMFYLRVPASLRENDPIPAPKLRHESTGLWIEFPLKKPASQRKSSVKTPVKTPVKILQLLKQNPNFTLADLAASIGKSVSATERASLKLVKEGKLRRIGPAKGGHWEVME